MARTPKEKGREMSEEMKLTLLKHTNVQHHIIYRPYWVCIIFGLLWVSPLAYKKKPSKRRFLISDIKEQS